MATKSTGGKRTASKSTRSSSSRSRKKTPPQSAPIRREAGAAVCLMLAVFAVLGFFPSEAIFIHFFSNFLKGLLGFGFWVSVPALLLASLFTILVSASAGLRTLLAAMDSLHDRENRHAFRRVAVSLALSALFLLTVYLSVVVIFTGEWFFWLLEEHLPRRVLELLPLSALSGLWRWMRYLLLFCFVLMLVLIVYRAGTPRGAMRRPVVLLSSLLAAAAIAGASVVFSWFIGMSSRYALVYGSLASLIILLVWLYLCGNILLLGAVVGRVLEDRLKR